MTPRFEELQKVCRDMERHSDGPMCRWQQGEHLSDCYASTCPIWQKWQKEPSEADELLVKAWRYSENPDSGFPIGAMKEYLRKIGRIDEKGKVV